VIVDNNGAVGTVRPMLIAFLDNSAPLLDQARLTVIVLWAMFLGGLVGIERERASKASGIRTHMLVAGASAVIVYISAQMTAASGGDASRGIHGVITGIGFLGAGAILQHSKKGVVTGLTTAASIFHTAAIGTAVAAGYGLAATVGTVIALIVLYGIGHFAHRHPIRPIPGAMTNEQHD
jgi:putative Mg2+ transporter-C (MgtC) family protein